jgi:hypothetical protein
MFPGYFQVGTRHTRQSANSHVPRLLEGLRPRPSKIHCQTTSITKARRFPALRARALLKQQIWQARQMIRRLVESRIAVTPQDVPS